MCWKLNNYLWRWKIWLHWFTKSFPIRERRQRLRTLQKVLNGKQDRAKEYVSNRRGYFLCNGKRGIPSIWGTFFIVCLDYNIKICNKIFLPNFRNHYQRNRNNIGFLAMHDQFFCNFGGTQTQLSWFLVASDGGVWEINFEVWVILCTAWSVDVGWTEGSLILFRFFFALSLR